MQAAVVDLVPFTQLHLDGAAALSRKAQWPHRRDDWAMVLGLSQGLVALSGDGAVMGTAFMTPFGAQAATINMVIVDEALRGRGIGRRLVAGAVALAGHRPLRLTATLDGQPLYRSLGFAAYGNIQQRQGRVRPMPAPDGVEFATAGDLETVARLDAIAYGADRRVLIRAVADCGIVAVIRRHGTVTAFAALREFGRGQAIGPVVAGAAEEARRLIAFFAAPRVGDFLRLDLVDDTGLEPWLDEIGFTEVDRGLAMRTVPPATTGSPGPRTFTLASQALG